MRRTWTPHLSDVTCQWRRGRGLSSFPWSQRNVLVFLSLTLPISASFRQCIRALALSSNFPLRKCSIFRFTRRLVYAELLFENPFHDDIIVVRWFDRSKYLLFFAFLTSYNSSIRSTERSFRQKRNKRLSSTIPWRLNRRYYFGPQMSIAILERSDVGLGVR